MTLLFEGKNPIFLSFKIVFLKSHCQFLCWHQAADARGVQATKFCIALGVTVARICSTSCCHGCGEALFHTHCFSRWECNTEKNKLFVHWLCPHGEHVFSLKVLRSNPLCSISLGCQVLAGTPPVLCPMSCLVLISKCPPYPHAAWLLFPGLAHCFIESIVARFLMHFAARVQEHSAI